jgi:hypothetical protein
METLKGIDGGLSSEVADKNKKIVEQFKTNFKAALTQRGVLNDFSLASVVQKAMSGMKDFKDQEKDVYEKIKDLLETPEPSPIPSEAAMSVPKDSIEKAA